MATASGVEGLADESMVTPPTTRHRGNEKTHVPSDVLDEYTFPIPQFAKARVSKRKTTLPHIIAHRGYKAKFPENSLLAFDEAVRAGATALETDVHLTKDDVVVLSHDGDLKKFGHPQKILDHTWDEIKSMKTLTPPHASMLRLADLLEYLLQPDRRDIWLLLDIKSDIQADDAVRLVATTIANVQSLPGKPWSQRILLGLWAGKYLPLAAKLLPGFSAVHTGFHLSHARRNLGVPHVGSNMLVQTLLAPGGGRFLQECQTRLGANIVWTVNDRDKTHWCIRRGLDGIVTDDPAVLAEILERYDEHAPEPLMSLSVWAYFDVFIIFVLANTLFWYFKRSMKLDDGNVRRMLRN